MEKSLVRVTRVLSSALIGIDRGSGVFCQNEHDLNAFRTGGVYCFPLPSYRCHCPLSANKLLASALMSHSHLSPAPSSIFQLIINNALEAYKKRTKKDLLAHPLASQLQACDSPTAILNVLQQQVQGVDQSRRSDDRRTKWLDPTVNILYALCDTLGEGVGLVSFKT